MRPCRAATPGTRVPRGERIMLLAISTTHRKKTPDKPVRPIARAANFAFPCGRGGGFIIMGAHIWWRLLAALPAFAGTWVHAACIDPAQFAHSTISISRYFDEEERGPRFEVIGITGTGWFLSETTIVTAAHVTDAMKLSERDWKMLEISGDKSGQRIGARLLRVAGDQVERLAVIELQHAVAAAQPVAIRKEPLVPEEQVMTFVYEEGVPHPVSGRFVRFGDERLAGTALLEMFEGDNRLAIDHGASGAPVLDCEGRVAAVISNVFTQTLAFASRQIRISTAWGTPNVVSVPALPLQEMPQGH